MYRTESGEAATKGTGGITGSGDGRLQARAGSRDVKRRRRQAEGNTHR